MRLLLPLIVFLPWVGVLARAVATPAGEVPIPAENQVPILLKVLTYDRQLEQERREVIRIGVLYAPRDGESRRWQEEICAQLEANSEKTVNGVPFEHESIAFTSAAALRRSLRDRDLDVLYLSGGLSGRLDEIRTLSREHHLLTMTGLAEYADSGVCVMLGMRDDRPEIVVDLRAAKATGCDLKASLLRLCRVIR